MYKIEVILNKENIEAAANLLPAYYKQQVLNEELLGILLWDIEYEEPAGLLLLGVQNNWMEIVWVEVAENYQGTRCADRLIKEAVSRAKKADDLYGVFAKLHKELDAEKMHYILKKQDFSFEEIPSDIYMCTVEKLMEVEQLRKINLTSKAVLLKDTTPKMKKQLIEAIHNERRAVPLPEHPDLDIYDGEISIVYGTEENVTAAVLVRKSQAGDLYLECAWGIDSRAVIYVLAAALAQVIQLYPPETTIIIPTITEVSKNLVLKLIPNITCEMMTQAKLLFV